MTLKALWDGKLIGSVRAHAAGDVCHVGRLIVHPDFQRRGIGARLMGEIETCFTQAARFQLFTGEQSLGNIRLYSRLGYRILRTESAPGGVALVHMEKVGACDSGSE